jgi:hypothetical protein
MTEVLGGTVATGIAELRQEQRRLRELQENMPPAPAAPPALSPSVVAALIVPPLQLSLTALQQHLEVGRRRACVWCRRQPNAPPGRKRFRRA